MALQQIKPTSYYGDCHGKPAFVRANDDGTWVVKVKDVRNRHAGHDGWVILGSDYPTLEAAVEATGVC